MRISDWSSDVCSSDLFTPRPPNEALEEVDRVDVRPGSEAASIHNDAFAGGCHVCRSRVLGRSRGNEQCTSSDEHPGAGSVGRRAGSVDLSASHTFLSFQRSEEHTSELQSIMRNPYA